MLCAVAKQWNKPLPRSPEPLYQVLSAQCSAFDMEIIFHSHVNKTHFRKKSYALGLILKVRVFGTRKWCITRQFFSMLQKKRTGLDIPCSCPRKDLEANQSHHSLSD